MPITMAISTAQQSWCWNKLTYKVILHTIFIQICVKRPPKRGLESYRYKAVAMKQSFILNNNVESRNSKNGLKRQIPWLHSGANVYEITVYQYLILIIVQSSAYIPCLVLIVKLRNCSYTRMYHKNIPRS